MNQNGRNMSLHRLAKQITLCNGAVSVWFWVLDPAIQSVILRQIRAARPGGEEEYEPLQEEIIELQAKNETKSILAKINNLAKQIENIRARYGNGWLSSYVIIDSCLADVELLDENNLDAVSLDCYWQARDGSDPIGNFDLFTQLLRGPFINELYVGYEDTRAKLPPAPAITQEVRPPENNPLGENGSPVKKGKSGKKQLENIS